MITTPPVTTEIHKTRVLLVDDHLVLRQGLAAMINEEPDLTVCGQADGVRAAMEIARMTDPDVAVVDLSIREGDGLELIKLLRDQMPSVLCLVLSMFDESVYAERALHAGAHGYVMKADAVTNVLIGIRSVARGGQFISPGFPARMSHRAGNPCAPDTENSDGIPRGMPAGGARGISRLSDRELQVLRRVGCGMSTREIAAELFISIKTVETHREHLKQKLELADSGELLRYAISYNRLGN